MTVFSILKNNPKEKSEMQANREKILEPTNRP